MYDTITIVSDELGEWKGLYLNGVLQLEGESLDAVEVLSVLGVTAVELDVDTEWLMECRSLPDNLEDVKLA